MASKRVQLEMDFRTWGGKRRGAGRPQLHRRCSEPHRERDSFEASSPVHVTLRLVDGLDTLRCRGAYDAVSAAMRAVAERPDFRIVHASIQRNHLHLVNEASDRKSLAKGIQALQISAAHHLKTHWERERGRRPIGAVFTDRYHAEIIESPTQARHALAYVLMNWRRHAEDRGELSSRWLLDPYSSALSFADWADGPERWTVPDDYRPLPTRPAETWLLRKGWKRVGPISMFERPGRKR